MDSEGVEGAVDGLMLLADACKSDRALIAAALGERIRGISDLGERVLVLHRLAEFFRESRPGLAAERHRVLGLLLESSPESHTATGRRLEVTRGQAQSIREGRGLRG